PQMIFAELRCFPTAKLGNICALYPMLDTSIDLNLPPTSGSLNLNGLVVQITADGLILYEQNSGRRVIPIVTNPYVFRADFNSLYRILATLGHGNTSTLQWDWGYSVGRMQFPAVRYENTVLSPKLYKLSWQELKNGGVDLLKKWGEYAAI